MSFIVSFYYISNAEGGENFSFTNAIRNIYIYIYSYDVLVIFSLPSEAWRLKTP